MQQLMPLMHYPSTPQYALLATHRLHCPAGNARHAGIAMLGLAWRAAGCNAGMAMHWDGDGSRCLPWPCMNVWPNYRLPAAGCRMQALRTFNEELGRHEGQRAGGLLWQHARPPARALARQQQLGKAKVRQLAREAARVLRA